MKKLSDYVEISNLKERIESSNLIYIGVDNMLSNARGITLPVYKPIRGNFHKFFTGDILIGNIRPYFKKIWLADQEGFCGNDVIVLRLFDNRMSKYIYSALSNNTFFEYVMKGAKGSKMPRGDKDHILEYPLININNKELVGNLIFNIFKKIEINNKINDNLNNQIKLIYKFWFNNSKNKETYKLVPFSKVADWESNSQPPKKDFIYEPKKNYIRFIQNRDYFNDSHKTYIPYSKKLKIATKLDIMMDKYGDAGRTRYGLEGAFNVALGKIVVKNELYREYIRSFLEDEKIYKYLNNSSLASTRASLSESNLSNLLIPFFGEDKTYIFGKISQKMRLQILQNKEFNECLMKIKDFIAPLLINGQAEIDD